jgi:hypothetical protein
MSSNLDCKFHNETGGSRRIILANVATLFEEERCLPGFSNEKSRK